MLVLRLVCAFALCLAGLGAALAAPIKPLVIVVHGVGVNGAGWSKAQQQAWRIGPLVELNFSYSGRATATAFTDAIPRSAAWIRYVRRRIKQEIDQHPDRPVMVIAHSWGTVMTKMAFKGGVVNGEDVSGIQLPAGRVAEWITLGSPLGGGAVLNRIQADGGKPFVVKRWTNFYDKDDPVSLPSWTLRGAKNRAVSGGYLLGISAHTGIWYNAKVKRFIQDRYQALYDEANPDQRVMFTVPEGWARRSTKVSLALEPAAVTARKTKVVTVRIGVEDETGAAVPGGVLSLACTDGSLDRTQFAWPSLSQTKLRTTWRSILGTVDPPEVRCKAHYEGHHDFDAKVAHLPGGVWSTLQVTVKPKLKARTRLTPDGEGWLVTLRFLDLRGRLLPPPEVRAIAKRGAFFSPTGLVDERALDLSSEGVVTLDWRNDGDDGSVRIVVEPFESGGISYRKAWFNVKLKAIGGDTAPPIVAPPAKKPPAIVEPPAKKPPVIIDPPVKRPPPVVVKPPVKKPPSILSLGTDVNCGQPTVPNPNVLGRSFEKIPEWPSPPPLPEVGDTPIPPPEAPSVDPYDGALLPDFDRTAPTAAQPMCDWFRYEIPMNADQAETKKDEVRTVIYTLSGVKVGVRVWKKGKLFSEQSYKDGQPFGRSLWHGTYHYHADQKLTNVVRRQWVLAIPEVQGDTYTEVWSLGTNRWRSWEGEVKIGPKGREVRWRRGEHQVFSWRRWWRPDGTLERVEFREKEGPKFQGYSRGWTASFNSDGTLSTRRRFGSQAGRVTRTWHESGAIKSEFIPDPRRSVSWGPNGQVTALSLGGPRRYSAGYDAQGRATRMQETVGTLTRTLSWKDGHLREAAEIPSGMRRTWHPGGKLSTKGLFESPGRNLNGRRVGIHEIWRPDGTIRERRVHDPKTFKVLDEWRYGPLGEKGPLWEKHFDQDRKKTGIWRTGRDDGTATSLRTWVGGVQEGMTRRFEKDGKTRRSEGMYVKGRRHGTHRLWRDGRPYESQDWAEGRKHGRQVRHRKSGQIVTLWKDGVRSGLEVWRDAAGRLARQTPYVNHKRHGVERQYREGKLYERVYFKDGNMGKHERVKP